MTRPGVQNPHCTAPSSTKACCTAVRVARSSGCRPSRRDDLALAHRRREHQARAHQHAVEEHRARAALTLLAARLRRREPEALAQHVQQALAEPRVARPSCSSPLTRSV